MGEFVIPLHLEDLEDGNISGHLLVASSLPTSELNQAVKAAGKAETEEGPEFIIEHFATFYSLTKNFKHAPSSVREQGLQILLKSFNKITLSLSEMLEEGIDPEIQLKICNMVKMTGYILIELAKRFQDQAIEAANQASKGKGKKNVKCDAMKDWTEEKIQLLSTVYNFLQLPIKMLWNPPVVDEEFINIFANFCYKCLEDSSITSTTMKPFRSTLFQVLGLLIRRHLHGLSFSVKVVQLLRMHEHLVNPLTQGVVEIINSGCDNIVREIVREVGECDELLLSDSAGARSLSQFLTAVAESSPNSISSAVKLLMAFLGRDPPALRCCALSVLGEVIVATLTKEDLQEDLKASRDLYLDTLEEHLHDVNAFVRTRCLQVWQRLCLAKAIPLARLNNLLDSVIGRLGDKSSYVKKQSVQLVKAMLEGNPYSGRLDVEDISTQLDEEKEAFDSFLKAHKFKTSVKPQKDWDKLEPQLRSALSEEKENSVIIEKLTIESAFSIIAEKLKKGEVDAAVGVMVQLKMEFYDQLGIEGEDDVETSLQLFRKIWDQTSSLSEIPDVSEEVLQRKDELERRLAYLEGALEFAKLIDRAIPLILTLLDSPTQSDMLEAVSFFTAAYHFGFPQALEGVKRMLYLVFSKEASIKAAICSAYKELYFSNASSDRKQSLVAVGKLSDLVITLNPSQLEAMQEVVKDWIQNDVLDKTCIQILFERFSKKIPGTTEAQSWAALAIISMIGAENSKVIRMNMSVLASEGLGPRGSKNFVLAQYTCKALQKLPTEGRFSADDEILTRLRRLLREGIWNSSQHYYTSFADEAISLVFSHSERPDAFAESLLVDIFLALKTGTRPAKVARSGRVLAQKKDFDDDLFSEPEKENIEPVEEVVEAPEVDMSNEGVILRMTRFLSLLGTVAAHYAGFLGGRVLGEFKRRNQMEYDRKKKRIEEKRADASMMEVNNEELEFNRQSADDLHAEQLKHVAEEMIVNGEGLLAKFLPFIETICREPGKYPNQGLQNAALLALGMFMLVSSRVCDEKLQLLVTLTEKSPRVEMRRNGLLLLWALQFRFPNILEPWTPHMIALLHDTDVFVRRTAVTVITSLIVNEMLKAWSHMSHLATRLVDKDTVIAQSTRHFFREFSQKGNSLFNVIPTLVTSMTAANSTIEEEDLHNIMKFVFGLITKDKQQELLVEKMCQYFECTTTDRQCRDLAFCLSLLHYSEKSLRKLLENFRYFGSKLYIAEVYESFMSILAQAAKNPQKDKNLLEDLHAFVKEYREKSCADRSIVVKMPTKKCPQSARKRAPRQRQMSDSDEDEKWKQPLLKSTRKRGTRQRQMSSDSDEDEKLKQPLSTKSKKKPSDSEEDEKVVRSTRKAACRRLAQPESDPDEVKKEIDSDDDFVVKKKEVQKVVEESSDSDSEVLQKLTKTTISKVKKSRGKSQSVCESDSDDEVARPVRNRKRK